MTELDWPDRGGVREFAVEVVCLQCHKRQPNAKGTVEDGPAPCVRCSSIWGRYGKYDRRPAGV